MARHVRKLGFPGNSRDVELTVPDGEPVPWGLDDGLTVVGTDVRRVDAVAKVTGRAKYTYDVRLPGMLHARIKYAAIGAGTVRGLALDGARQRPGVRGVLALKKVGDPILHPGDELAAVAAESEDEAEDALQAIEVEIEPLPAVTTIDQAMAPGARQVFPGKDNVRSQRLGGDDPDRAEREARAALARAARVVEATYETQVQTHNALEPHGVLARFEKDGGITLWASTQGTFGVKGEVVEHLKLPDEKVRVLAEYVGGGFGSKFGIDVCGKVAIALAKQTGRPVKCMLSREEEHLTGGNRPSSRQTMRAGIDRQGRIQGVVVEVWGTGGIGGGAGASNPAIYEWGKKFKIEHAVYTNGPASRAFRAPGHPQGIFAVESMMDELAHAAGLDPLEFRKRNVRHPFYEAQWELGAREIGWAQKRNPRPGSERGVRKRGVGMASTLWYQMGRPGSEVDVTIHADGTVVAANGAQDIGTGTKTVLATIVAEELGLRPEAVQVRLGDTNLPVGPGSGGSATAPGVGPAARHAGVLARQALARVAGRKLGAPPESLRFEGGRVLAEEGRSLSFREAARLIPTGKLTVRGVRGKNVESYHPAAGGCQFAEVEVDTETGVIRVLKIVAVQDAGQPISKLLFESQILGGVIQGLSYALHEERILDPRHGVQLNADLLSYKIAGPLDMPEIVPIAFNVRNGGNACSMLGLGEPPKIPTAAAIANAVFNATGRRVRALPMTPRRVLEALS